MRNSGRKLIGWLFIAVSIAGAVFCLYGIVQVWRYRPVAENTAQATLDVTLQTLKATEDGLDVIDEMVQTTSGDVQILETTIQTLTLAISNTNTVLDSLGALTSEDLPAAFDATQTSLASAETSAALIDDFMGALASIPLLRLGVYRPAVPLSTAIGDISDSLAPLSPSLETISGSIDDASTNLAALGGALESASETTQEVQTALEDAVQVVADYREVTTDLTKRVERMQQTAPANIRSGAWILTALLLVLLFPQFGLAERGLHLLQEPQDKPVE